VRSEDWYTLPSETLTVVEVVTQDGPVWVVVDDTGEPLTWCRFLHCALETVREVYYLFSLEG
jgi:hypothetical protein